MVHRATKSLTRMSHLKCTQSCKYCCYLCLTNGEALLLLFSHQILSDSLWPHGLYTPWNSLGQNTGVGSASLLQGISLVAKMVKCLPAMWETWVRSLGWEDSLEKGKAIHSSILAWRIPWTVYSVRLQRVRHDWATFTFTNLWLMYGHKYFLLCFPLEAYSFSSYV